MSMSNPAFSAATVANGLQRCSSKSGGMLVLQYARIVLEIIARAPANVLVFGAGADTAMYVDANPGGRTVYFPGGIDTRHLRPGTIKQVALYFFV
ncbi:hypothetical protein [Rosistilla oblonga]|uniref:hypothetical protein n=1 Tax=Rosistilla oblonga TaxID=2527990 RepID=UPI003A97C5EE